MKYAERTKKILKISMIILACLTMVFICCFIGFTIEKSYAEDHYDTTIHTKFENYFDHTYVGCGETNCKYCKGKETRIVSYGDMYNEFIYYRTIKSFWIGSLVLMSVSFAGIGGVLVFLFVRRGKRKER